MASIATDTTIPNQSQSYRLQSYQLKNSRHSYTLENGLKVVLQESHVAPVASFWVFYRVGSRNEIPGKTGISHWVEHMLFKGTEQFPRGEFDKAVSRAGGVFNGMTGQDWTTYFETFPSERIELALQVESDRMVNAIFDVEETESERTVIISEREGQENSYFYLLSEELQASAFAFHSYRNPIIGWKSDLLSMNRENLYDHYRTFYTPNNAVIVAVGDFETEAMMAQIEQYFGNLPSGPTVPTMQLQEPEQLAERRLILQGNDPNSYLLMGLHTPEATHDDFFALTVMDAVLGGSKGMGLSGGGTNNRSNRLYKALIDSQLAVGVGSSYQPTIDPSLFNFYAVMAPGVEHQAAEDAIWTEIEKVQADGVTTEELEKAIKQTKAQFVYSSESVTNQAYWLGFSEMVADTRWLDGWVDQLSAVTSEEVQQAAQKYFVREQQTVGWYRPDGEE